MPRRGGRRPRSRRSLKWACQLSKLSAAPALRWMKTLRPSVVMPQVQRIGSRLAAGWYLKKLASANR